MKSQERTSQIDQKRTWTSFPYFVRIASFAVSKQKYNSLFSTILFCIWKFQLFGFPILLGLRYLTTQDYFLYSFLKTIVKFMVIGELFNPNSDDAGTSVAFIIIQIYTYMCIGVNIMLLISLMKQDNITICQRWYGYLCYLQQNVMSFISTDFNLMILTNYYQSNLLLFQSSMNTNMVLAILSFISLVWNFIFTFVIINHFQTSLKQSEILSTKTKRCIRIEYINRFWGILLFYFLPEGIAKQAMLIVIIFATSICRDLLTFQRIPYYYLGVLYLDIRINAVYTTIASLNFLAFIFQQSGAKNVIDFSFTAWILLSILNMKMYNIILLKNLATNLRKPINESNEYYLLQRIYLYTHAVKNQIVYSENQKKFDVNYLLVAWKNSVVSSMTKDDGTTVKFDFNIKEHRKCLQEYFFRKCVAEHPNSWPLRIAYLNCMIKYSKSYLKALDFIEKHNKEGTPFPVMVSLALIKNTFESELFAEKKIDQNNTEYLSMVSFMTSVNNYDSIRQLIQNKNKIQNEIWQHYLEPESNFARILKLSNKVNEFRSIIENEIKQFGQQNKYHWAAPYLSIGLYYSTCENMPATAEKFIQLYSKMLYSLDKSEKTCRLKNENMFDPLNASLTVSGTKKKLGTIINCSSSVEKLFGYSKDYLMGANCKILIPPFIRERHDQYLNKYFETGQSKTLDKTTLVRALNKDGYMFRAYLHIKLIPFLNTGTNYLALFRPIRITCEIISVKSDYTVEGITQKLAKDLGINLNERNIKISQISQELLYIIDICNQAAAGRIITETETKLLAQDIEDQDAINVKEDHEHNTVDTVLDTNRMLSAEQQSTARSLIQKNRHNQMELSQMEEKSINISFSTIDNQKSGGKCQLFETTQGRNFMRKIKQSSISLDEAKREFEKLQTNGIEIILKKVFFPDDYSDSEDFFKCCIKVDLEVYDSDWLTILLVDHIQGSKLEDSPSPKAHQKTSQNHNYKIEVNKSLDIKLDLKQILLQPSYDPKMNQKNKASLENGEISPRFHDLIQYSSPSEETIPDEKQEKVKIIPIIPLFQNPDPEQKISFQSVNIPEVKEISQEVLSIPKNIHIQTNLKLKIPELSSGVVNDQDFLWKDNIVRKQKPKNSAADENKNRQIESKNETSFGSSNSIKLFKTIEEAMEYTYCNARFRLFNIAYLIMVLVVVGIIIAQGILAITTYQNGNDKANVVRYTISRLHSTIIMAQELDTWISLLQGFNGVIPPQVSQLFDNEYTAYINIELQKIAQFNVELEQNINLFKCFESFYEQTILFRMWENNITTPTNISLNSFEAYNQMIIRAQRFLKENQNNLVYGFSGDSNSETIVGNVYNDLFLQSTSSIIQLANEVNNDFITVQTSIFILFLLALFTITSFEIFLFWIFRVMNQSGFEFSNRFGYISQEDTMKAMKSLQKFTKVLESNLLNEDMTNYLHEQSSSSIQTPSHTKIKKFKMRDYYMINLKLILGFGPILCLMSVLVINFFTLSKSNINLIEGKASQSFNIGLRMLNQSLLYGLAVEDVSTNETLIALNMNVAAALSYHLPYVSNIESFLNYFNGVSDDVINSYLYNTSCNAGNIIVTEEQTWLIVCNHVSNGAGHIGLVELIEQSAEFNYQAIAELSSNERTQAFLVQFFQAAGQTFYYTEIAERALFTELSNYVLDTLYSTIDQQVNLAIIYVTIFSISVAILKVVSHLTIQQTMRLSDDRLKRILKIVPISVLLKNKLLLSFLEKTSDGLLQSISTSLQQMYILQIMISNL